jgi:N-acetylmuramoyl-L-alanine amidase
VEQNQMFFGTRTHCFIFTPGESFRKSNAKGRRISFLRIKCSKPKMKAKTSNSCLKSSALVVSVVTAYSTVQASSDYGPAIWRQAYSGHWYTSGNGKKFYVEHDMEGYYLSTISFIQGGGGPDQVSVHYCVNGLKDNSSDSPAGEITQMVLDVNYAWHVGCWNTYCMGTEHEGFASNPAWYTEAMYQTSAAVTKFHAEKYGFAKDRNHIVGHNAWQSAAWRTYASANFGINPNCNSHTDPGPYWDWTHYMNLVNGRHPAKVGAYHRSDGTFHLRNSLSGGSSDLAFGFGPPGKIPLMGDWNGDGTATCGYYDPDDGSFHLRNSNSTGSSDIAYVGGPTNMIPLIGDWDGDGKTSAGYYNPGDGSIHLRNSLSPGPSDYAYVFISPPNSSLIVVAGDWDGDGKTSIGYFNPADGTWHLRNSLSQGASDYAFGFGDGTYTPTPWW